MSDWFEDDEHRCGGTLRLDRPVPTMDAVMVICERCGCAVFLTRFAVVAHGVPMVHRPKGR